MPIRIVWSQFPSVLLVFMLSSDIKSLKGPGVSGEASQDGRVDHLETFQRLLKEKHMLQVLSLNDLMKGNDNISKIPKLTALIWEKLKEVVMKNRLILQESGFIPGSEFPEMRNIQEALALVIENTGMFAEWLLRFPHPTKQLLDKDNHGKLLLTWGITFSLETGFLTPEYRTLLHYILMYLLLQMTKASQELGIGDLDPNYKNPFRQTIGDPTSEKLVISSEEDWKENIKQKKKPKSKSTSTSKPHSRATRHDCHAMLAVAMIDIFDA
ncbi:unnamed protein product [Darwinula stevensoni]|uniref:Uncharacterized protein n=1 Tax=Darwinula stevensoni TaxID=69355 RepID=A0A7R9A784_9CRUS|nr:unnamed protein product [Darwinula stevensoni]CAG0890652.1 unnamed protein product [Darwinula stevensoni]